MQNLEIKRDRLTDGSFVFSVVWDGLRIDCEDAAAATDICQAINQGGLSWTVTNS